ncbi:MAG: ferrochelatase [Thermodesulfovibrionales bacterium]|nr:ferrochelatase [Thermodesulfovibrionales bacterium]
MLTKNGQIGVLLLNMGGPDSLDAVKPFLKNLFSDRDIIRLGPSFLQKPISSIIINKRLPKTIQAYSLIGGKSPLPEITNQQAVALEKTLNTEDNSHFVVSIGMRYWHPFIRDTLVKMRDKEIKTVIGLSLYPQYSKATSGSTLKVFEDVATELGLSHKSISSWFDNPIYLDSLVEVINEGINRFSSTPYILFSAHNLPKKFVDSGDPYVKETEATVRLLIQRLNIDNWSLAYQSKTGPVRWLEPTTDDVIIRLSKQKVKDLLIVPISFVSDHIETLYEIDMLYKDLANSLGIRLIRTESLNTRGTFINALKDLVMKVSR